MGGLGQDGIVSVCACEAYLLVGQVDLDPGEAFYELVSGHGLQICGRAEKSDLRGGLTTNGRRAQDPVRVLRLQQPKLRKRSSNSKAGASVVPLSCPFFDLRSILPNANTTSIHKILRRVRGTRSNFVPSESTSFHLDNMSHNSTSPLAQWPTNPAQKISHRPRSGLSGFLRFSLS